MNSLNHVAIIMDGNGRWGVKYKKSRNAGHKAGLKTVERIIKASVQNKIKHLTLFAFSTENWKRPKVEIDYLFNLLENYLFSKIEDSVIANQLEKLAKLTKELKELQVMKVVYMVPVE